MPVVPVGALAGAHRDAGLAGAEDAALLEVEQVAVVLGELGAAEVAALARPGSGAGPLPASARSRLISSGGT